jgi:hypothetical protein
MVSKGGKLVMKENDRFRGGIALCRWSIWEVLLYMQRIHVQRLHVSFGSTVIVIIMMIQCYFRGITKQQNGNRWHGSSWMFSSKKWYKYAALLSSVIFSPILSRIIKKYKIVEIQLVLCLYHLWNLLSRNPNI